MRRYEKLMKIMRDGGWGGGGIRKPLLLLWTHQKWEPSFAEKRRYEKLIKIMRDGGGGNTETFAAFVNTPKMRT